MTSRKCFNIPVTLYLSLPGGAEQRVAQFPGFSHHQPTCLRICHRHGRRTIGKWIDQPQLRKQAGSNCRLWDSWRWINCCNRRTLIAALLVDRMQRIRYPIVYEIFLHGILVVVRLSVIVASHMEIFSIIMSVFNHLSLYIFFTHFWLCCNFENIKSSCCN